MTDAAALVNSHFEGGQQQIETRFAFSDQLDNCAICAPKKDGGTMVQLNGGAAQFSNCRFSAAGFNTYAVTFGLAGMPSQNHQISNCQFSGFNKLTPFNFANGGGGQIISARGFFAADGATTFGGTPHSSTRTDYVQGGTVINVRT